MAIRGNIGSLAAAISEGKRAASRMNTGPVPNPAVLRIDQRNAVSNWDYVEESPLPFLWGSHKWGALDRKVAK